MPHISIKPEVLFEIFGLHVTNSALTAVIASIVLAAIIFYYNAQLKKKKTDRSLVFYALNSVLSQLYTLFASVTGDKIKVLFPLISCFFVFILVQNWFG